MKKVFLCTSLWMLSLLLVTSCKNAPQSMGSADYKTMEVEYGNCTLSQSSTEGKVWKYARRLVASSPKSA